jgi:hypothetical protein
VTSSNQRAAEYRRRAAEARRMANAASTPSERADLIQVEKGWLRLATKAERQAPSQGKVHRRGRAKD